MMGACSDPGTRRLITLSVLAATFMQALDTTIANVALPHMQGSVSASADEIIWVLTSYIVAAAIFTPLSGWLASRFGRQKVILVAIAGFSAASGLCGTATSIQELVCYRLLQGMFGAPLQPLSQAVLLDINPPERHGSAMALWGVGAMLAPVVGPTLGGWLTDNFSWRWVFFINLPIGVLAYLGIAGFLKEKAVARPVHFNFPGFTLLALALVFVQLVLERGQGKDWFASNEICVEAGAGLIFTYLFIVNTMTAYTPFISRELFADRNFVVATATAFLVNMILFSVLALLPQMLTSLMNYPVVFIGLVTAPRGVGTLISMVAAGQLVKRIDPRWVLLVGFVLIAIAQIQMSGFSLGMDASPVILSGFIQGTGSGLVLLPLTTISFATLRSELRNEGAAMYTLIRAMGSAFGVAVLQAITIRNVSIVRSQLVEQVRPDNPLLEHAYPNIDFAASADMAGLNAAVSEQASMVAYVDAFHMLFIVAIATMPLLLLLRARPREQR
jgi:DHA2 family multidrug resistance protein